jgi:hypothetical protein
MLCRSSAGREGWVGKETLGIEKESSDISGMDSPLSPRSDVAARSGSMSWLD